jgi:foldase protein PrsA
MGCGHAEVARTDAAGEAAPLQTAAVERTSLTAEPAPQKPAKPALLVEAPPAIASPRVASSDQVIAVVEGRPITMQQLTQPLIEAHGLSMLQNLVLLEVTKQEAEKKHVTINADDIAEQRRTTLEAMVKESKSDQDFREKLALAEAKGDKKEAQSIRDAMNYDREEFLDQFLHEKNLSRREFEFVIETNTYVRKMVEPEIAPLIKEETLKAAFGMMYGEKARVLCIVLPNLAQVLVAQKRLHSGDHFEDVSHDMSVDPQIRDAKGEVRPFSRADTGVPESIKEAAFALKKDEVSEPISDKGRYFLVKLIERISPKAVKYENEKESIRVVLYNELLTKKVVLKRNELATEAAKAITIEEPTLKKQYQEIQEQAARNREKMSQAMKRDSLLNNPGATTAPTTAPADAMPGPVTLPVPATPPAAAGGQPPATQPGSAR